MNLGITAFCLLTWGPFNKYVDKILPLFDHPSTYVDKIFTLEVDKIWTILDQVPTFSCPRSYWMTPWCTWFATVKFLITTKISYARCYVTIVLSTLMVICTNWIISITITLKIPTTILFSTTFRKGNIIRPIAFRTKF